MSTREQTAPAGGLPDGVTITAHHDLIGVGLGPFNLALAALVEPLDLRCAFFDQRSAFSWHPGLLLDGTTLQVPFLADLVTMADPTSRFSFLNYLHEHGRLFRFYFYERFHIPRLEYDRYCRWVAEQLDSCRFGRRVVAIHADEAPDGPGDVNWIVEVASGSGREWHGATHVVLGVGTRPHLPACAEAVAGENVLHTADYLEHRPVLDGDDHLTVIGSGQSAAEVFVDQLRRRDDGRSLEWFTRSRGFLPMEYSKLGLEHFTPEYTTWFHGLDERARDEVRAGQDLLYKGISESTSAEIFDLLYERSVSTPEHGVAGVTYAAGCELLAIEPSPGAGRRYRLVLRQRDDGRTFTRETDAVVLGTGHRAAPLPLGAAGARFCSDDHGRPVIDLDRRLRRVDGRTSTVFVQGTELHSHGVGAPDLGLGAHRAATIVNAIAAREVYAVRDHNVFQTFGPPSEDGA